MKNKYIIPLIAFLSLSLVSCSFPTLPGMPDIPNDSSETSEPKVEECSFNEVRDLIISMENMNDSIEVKKVRIHDNVFNKVFINDKANKAKTYIEFDKQDNLIYHEKTTFDSKGYELETFNGNRVNFITKIKYITGPWLKDNDLFKYTNILNEIILMHARQKNFISKQSESNFYIETDKFSKDEITYSYRFNFKDRILDSYEYWEFYSNDVYTVTYDVDFDYKGEIPNFDLNQYEVKDIGFYHNGVDSKVELNKDEDLFNLDFSEFKFAIYDYYATRRYEEYNYSKSNNYLSFETDNGSKYKYRYLNNEGNAVNVVTRTYHYPNNKKTLLKETVSIEQGNDVIGNQLDIQHIKDSLQEIQRIFKESKKIYTALSEDNYVCYTTSYLDKYSFQIDANNPVISNATKYYIKIEQGENGVLKQSKIYILTSNPDVHIPEPLS